MQAEWSSLHACHTELFCVQVMEPGNTSFLNAIHSSHRDPEAEIFRILVDLRCALFLDSYVATLESDQRMGPQKHMPLGLKAFRSIGGWTGSFHPLNNGIDFRQDNFAVVCGCCICLRIRSAVCLY